MNVTYDGSLNFVASTKSPVRLIRTTPSSLNLVVAIQTYKTRLFMKLIQNDCLVKKLTKLISMVGIKNVKNTFTNCLLRINWTTTMSFSFLNSRNLNSSKTYWLTLSSPKNSGSFWLIHNSTDFLYAGGIKNSIWHFCMSKGNSPKSKSQVKCWLICSLKVRFLIQYQEFWFLSSF